MRLKSNDSETVSFTSETYSSSVQIKSAASVGIFLNNTVAASTADTFVDADVTVAADTIALPSHGWLTGRKVAATTSGVLPGGLSATDYFIIKVDANTVKLATNLANALAGTAVDITSAAGGGTHTLTPAALASASYQTQISPDEGTTWFDLASATANITSTGKMFEKHEFPPWSHVRIKFSASAGQVSTVINILQKEDGANV